MCKLTCYNLKTKEESFRAEFKEIDREKLFKFMNADIWCMDEIPRKTYICFEKNNYTAYQNGDLEFRLYKNKGDRL